MAWRGLRVVGVKEGPRKRGATLAIFVSAHSLRVKVLCFDTDSQVFIRLGLGAFLGIGASEQSLFFELPDSVARNERQKGSLGTAPLLSD